MSKNLPEEIINLIFSFSSIRCHVCYNRLKVNNVNNFFCYPRNDLSNTNSHYYCSLNCFNYI